MKNIFKNRKGLGMFEMVLSMGVIAAFSVTVLGIYAGLRTFNLEDTPLTLIQHIRLTHNNSIMGLNRSKHGIRFESNKYTLYQGESYETRNTDYDQNFDLPDGVILCWSLFGEEGAADEINFSKSEGMPDNIGIIVATNIRENLTKVIRVNEAGRADYEVLLEDYCACTAEAVLVCEDVDICHHPPGAGGASDMCNGQTATIYVKNGIIHGGPDDGETYYGILNGTKKEDVIVGTNGDDIIYGGSKDDIICGSWGNNTIYSGKGNDIIYSRRGDDIIYGDNGDNIIIAEGGDNYIDSGNGKDFIITGAGNDTIGSGNAKDVIISYGGDNNIDAGTNNSKDIICTGNGDDNIEGGNGSDSINSNGGDDTILGGNGSDICLNGENISDCEKTLYCEDGCGQCHGGLKYLTLKYTGNKAAGIKVKQNDNNNIIFNANVNPGEQFLFFGNDDGVMGTKITIYINDTEDTIIYTNCSKGIGKGLVAGNFEIINGKSKNGGPFCNVHVNENCGECNGKVADLTLRYNGSEMADIKVKQQDDDIVFDESVNPGEEFSFSGADANGTFGLEIKIYINDSLDYTEIHTSCSKDIGPGIVAGDFEIVSGTSKNGGALCEARVDCSYIPECDLEYYDEDGVAVCHYPRDNRYINQTIFVDEVWVPMHLSHGDILGICDNDLEVRTITVNAINLMSHLGHGDGLGACEAICHWFPPSQGEELCSECIGGVIDLTLKYNGSETANIKVEQKQGNEIIFDASVDSGEEFSFAGRSGGTMGSEIALYINDIEDAVIHTSCSQDIGPSLVSGSFTILSGHSNGGEFCELVKLEPEGCGECDGRINYLTLQYNGDESAKITIKQNNYVILDYYTRPGEELTFAGRDGGDMGPEIKIYKNNEDDYISLDTGCLAGVGIGYTIDDFEIISGTSKDGGPLCFASPQGDQDGICGKNNNDKVDVCHYPPGNPENAHNICISHNGVPAHIREHGDVIGKCIVSPQGSFVTLNVNQENVGAHLAHGDSEGACTEVPQECGECGGRTRELTLKYNGVSRANVKVEQKKGSEIIFNDTVVPDQEFTFIGTDDGTLGTEIRIYVDDTLDTRIHTSCSKKYIGTGLVRGNFEIISGLSRFGGPICPMPECSSCSGKVNNLSLQFNGIATSTIKVQQQNHDVIFENDVAPEEVITFNGSYNWSMGNEIIIYVNDTLNTQIHTSCSQEIGPGLITGDFEVIFGFSRKGGVLCEIE